MADQVKNDLIDRPCTIEDLTVDASVSGDIMEVEKSDGTKEFVPARFRQPYDMNVFCDNCGAELELSEVADHLAGVER